MSKKRSTKRALFSSIIAMILCCTMLLGTTFAWFTSTVSNTGNRIQAGTLKVDLLMDKAEDGNYESIADTTGDIFSIAEGGNGILWEPGKTEIVYLKVENKGSLALKYNVALIINDDNLAGGLEYAIIDGMTAATAQADGIDSWKAIEAYDDVQIAPMPCEEVTATPNAKLLANDGQDGGEDEDYLALAVHMKEDAGDEYQGKELTFDLKIQATQVPEEEDSFGTDYDVQAVLPAKEIVLDEWNNLLRGDGTSDWSLLALPDKGVKSEVVEGEDGDTYLLLDNPTWSTYYQANKLIQDAVAGQVYKLSADVNWVSGHAPQIRFAYRNYTSSTQYTTVSTSAKYTTVADTLKTAGTEGRVELEFTIPEGANAVYIQIWAEMGASEWDNIELVTNGNKVIAWANEFRAMLAEEKANSQQVVAEKGDPNAESPTFPGQPDNIVVNGDLETGDATGWNVKNASYSNYMSIVEDPDDSENTVIKFDAKNGGAPYPFYDQFVDVVGGAEYQVSYRYKITGDKGTARVKIEYYTDRSLPGASYLAEIYVGPQSDPIRDGEWHEVVQKIYPSQNVEEFWVLARMNAGSTGNGEIYMDDIKITMTQPPAAVALDTDQIFYYTDAKGGTFTASANMAYFSGLENAKTDFQVYDGTTLIWEKTGVVAENGVATTDFSFVDLMKMNTPYCVKATMYNADGSVAGAASRNIYIVERPEWLRTDGIYMKNGEEPFYPTYAYHVNLEDFDECASAGINLVQIGGFGSAESALRWLDAAEENGIMGLMVLYGTADGRLQAAAHDKLLERNIKVLSDERVLNHPALYGYAVMDEVFLQLADPEEVMENSYRFIRMLDPYRPITTMEALPSYYEKSAKYVDVLCIDPYAKASLQRSSSCTIEALEAVNYEKPVYTLLEAYRNAYGFPKADDLRNNCWQALIAGADAVGYFAICDSDIVDGVKYPMYKAPTDGGASNPDSLWSAVVEFGTKERNLAHDHYIFGKSPAFNEVLGQEYWYSSWVADGGIYMIVLGMVDDQQLSVQIPLTSTDGSVAIGEYTAEIIAGGQGTFTGSGTLDVPVNGVEAILYKITPTAEVDFSSLN